MKQNIAVLTTSRSEYYQIRTILKAIIRRGLSLQLFVSGSHLSPQFGRSEQDIEADGFAVSERLPILVDDDSGIGSALTAGLAVQMVAGALTRNKTDLLILAGDRYETLAAALAATSTGVPIAHLHGGEATEGAFDDVCRHAITKLSSLHFVSTDVYRARVIQMGEMPERVFTIGAPLLDEILTTELLTQAQLTTDLGIKFEHPVGLITYHPTTREQSDDGSICQHILQAVAGRCKTIIATAPNHDPGYQEILDTLTEFISGNDKIRLFSNLGSRAFLSLLAYADIMVGNSSSGIHEAVSYRLPVVNVGSRQRGRLRPRNVLDSEPDKESIQGAVECALSAEFRKSLAGLKNPYGDGSAGERLVSCLDQFAPFKKTLLQKSFHDGPEVQAALETWARDHDQ